MKIVIAGAEFAASKRKTLPKKGIGDVELFVNGTPFSAKVTSNAAWCGGKDWIEYIWIESDGVVYFITLDYNVPAASFAGADLIVQEGLAARKNPIRGPEALVGPAETEARRIEKFKATWKARAAA